MAISHVYVSGKSDGTDATLVRASAWNAQHTVDQWEFLGRSVLTSAAATIDLMLLYIRKRIVLYWYIPGYATTAVMRILPGTVSAGVATYDVTAANYWWSVFDDNAAVTTANGTRYGIPVAQTPITGGRWGHLEIRNATVLSGNQKTFEGSGMSGAVSAVPVHNTISGLWGNTTSQIGAFRGAAFATLGAETSVNLLTGTELYAIGRDDN